MQCRLYFRSIVEESNFLKPTGHDQFHASLAASKTLDKFLVKDLHGPKKDDDEYENDISHQH